MYFDSRKRPRTESLFIDTFKTELYEKGYEPVWTMRPYEHKGCPSAYQVYMEADSEYDAAMKITGDMRHWRKLCTLKWFMEGAPTGYYEGLKQWRLDKAAKEATKVLNLIKNKAEEGNVTAQRTLLEYYKNGGPEGHRQPKLTPQEQERQAKIIELHQRIEAKKSSEQSSKKK